MYRGVSLVISFFAVPVVYFITENLLAMWIRLVIAAAIFIMINVAGHVAEIHNQGNGG